MAVKDILLLGNPVLRMKSKRVEKITDKVEETITDLKETLENFRNNFGFGRGISAPQIGSLSRIIFVDIGEKIPLINPRIISRSRETMRLWDDCFSFPEIVVKVKRYKRIKVEYFDGNFKKNVREFVGDQSELLQHEIDHLDGVLALDRAIDSTHIILRSEWEKLIHSRKKDYLL